MKILIIILLLSTAAIAQEPFVGNSFEFAKRELGPAHSIHNLPGDIQILEYYDVLFLYLDVQSNTVVFERSYVGRRMTRRIVKDMDSFLPVKNGWHYSGRTNLHVRVYIEAGANIIEIRRPECPLADLVIKRGW